MIYLLSVRFHEMYCNDNYRFLEDPSCETIEKLLFLSPAPIWCVLAAKLPLYEITCHAARPPPPSPPISQAHTFFYEMVGLTLLEKTGIYEVTLGTSFYVMKWRFIKGVNPTCFIVGNLKGDACSIIPIPTPGLCGPHSKTQAAGPSCCILEQLIQEPLLTEP